MKNKSNLEKISFENTQMEQFIRGGEDSVVICKATSIPGPEISWFRKGIHIELKNGEYHFIVIKNIMSTLDTVGRLM